MGVWQVYKQPGYRESSGIGHALGDILEGGGHIEYSYGRGD